MHRRKAKSFLVRTKWLTDKSDTKVSAHSKPGTALLSMKSILRFILKKGAMDKF